MRKLTNKKIRWTTRQLKKETPVREIAGVMRVTPRRIYQLKRRYEESGKIPELKRAGRKPKPHPAHMNKKKWRMWVRYERKHSTTL